MDIKTQSALLAAIITCATAISMLLRSRKNRLYVLFSILNFNLFLWYVSDFFYDFFEVSFISQFQMIVAVFIPINTLRFFLSFLGESSRFALRAYRISLGFAGIFIPLILFQLNNRFEWINWIIFSYVFIYLYLNIFFLVARFRHMGSDIERARLKYLTIGGGIAITLVLLDYLATQGLFFPTLGNIFLVIYLYFFSQIVLHRRLLDLYEFLGRSIIMSILAIILASIYGILVAWAGDQLGLFFFNTIVASFVILILYDPLKNAIENRVTRLLFRESFEFSKQLNILRRDMANIINVDEMAGFLMSRLERSRRVTHASLYLLEDAAYKVLAYIGPTPIERIETIMHQIFLRNLEEKNVLVLEEIVHEINELAEEDTAVAQGRIEIDESIVKTMNALLGGVSVALLSDGKLIGFLNLNDERLKEAFSSDEIKLLVGVAAQATITIENSKLFEKMKERERLAALGEMSAGLAHEIRNPLGAIKGASQLLSSGGDLESNKEFIAIITEEVDRLDGVVSQFLDYSRPLKSELSPCDINSIVERVCQLLQAEKDDRIEIDKGHLMEGLPKLKTDAENLRQVFINLALNAFQAMPNGGVLTIRTSLMTKKEFSSFGKSERQYLRIEFQDSGIGIPESSLKHIFIPFYTTKEKGTGLGLAISQKIIQNLGGSIEVESKESKGSTFTVLLPLPEEDIKEPHERVAAENIG